MPTIPFTPLALGYLAAMLAPLTVMLTGARHVAYSSITRYHLRLTVWFGAGAMYVCFWNAWASAGWLGAVILGPLCALGVWMAVLLGRLDRLLHDG